MVVVEKSGAEGDALDVNVCDVLFMTFLKFLHVLFLGDVDDYVMDWLEPFLSFLKKKSCTHIGAGCWTGTKIRRT